MEKKDFTDTLYNTHEDTQSPYALNSDPNLMPLRPCRHKVSFPEITSCKETSIKVKQYTGNVKSRGVH
ncbi:hypothetical protein M8J77_023711 [Diaphorina citri]|nr:hypothetical protein M8J77_023711 [Diaphorina citri]